MLLSENGFYALEDTVTKTPEEVFPSGWYPTVEDLLQNKADKENQVLFLPTLIYFSSNPYIGDEEIGKRQDYKDLVSFCKKILYGIPLQDE